MKIAGETVMVTGGSSGLGAATAMQLVKRNAKVVIADRNPPTETDKSILFCETDVTDENSLASAFQVAVQRYGSVRGAVVSAGIIHGERILGREGLFDLQNFRRVIDVNLTGTFNVLRLAASVMQDNEPDNEGERGVIVMTSSVAAYEGQIGQAAYSASKGGVASMTLPAARELARFGIRVVTIAPGCFETPMMQQVSEKHYDAFQSQTIFPSRLGRPKEFADLAIHVMENPMINGTVIRLDGAMRMSPE